MRKFLDKLFPSVPADLQEQFDDIQLTNSLYRIRILTIIALAAKIINPLFIIITKKRLDIPIEEYFNYIDYTEIAVIILFNLAVFLFNKKRILWIICHLVIASFFILYEFMNFSETYDRIPQIFFVTMFLFTILPDFKPKIFISYAVFYITATGLIPIIKGQPTSEFFIVYSRLLIIFLIILFTKISLYNSKVKTFINTYQINKLNDSLVVANREIKNYNDNLEKMVQEKTETIVLLRNAVMETIAELVERRDGDTGEHISRTSRLLKIFANALLSKGLYGSQTSSWNVDQLVLSAQLHDVGKIAIDDNILRKPGKLTDEEFNTMKKHTIFGGDIIKKIQNKTGESEFLDYANTFAVYHHEKWNGGGYPYGISGEKIPLPARLMAIIDVYDALISERPYKKAFSQEEAVKIIKEGRGTHFDPELTDLFLSIADQFKKTSS